MTKHFLINLLFALLAIIFYWLQIAWYWWMLGWLLYGIVIFLGSYFIQLNFFITSHNCGNSSEKKIALSFDDGPSVAHTPALLDFLQQEKISASFFLIGKNIAGNEGLLQRMFEEGHTLGNHSYEHGFWFSVYSRQVMEEEIKQCNRAIKNVIGKQPLLFRPPYGVTNPLVANAIKATHMKSIGWSLRSYDTVAPSKEALVKRVSKHLKAGDIVLMHDHGEHTLAALPEIIAYVRQQGYTIVPLHNLLKIEAYAT